MISIGQLIAALLLPPLAIWLQQGLSRDFWITFALTCLGYLPGIAFALFTLLRGRVRDPQLQPQPETQPA